MARINFEALGEQVKAAHAARITAALPEVYFEPYPNRYWVRNARREFITLEQPNVVRLLAAAGISKEPGELGLSEMDHALLFIQTSLDVHYGGPLAGMFEGLHTVLGKQILVATSPTLIEPTPGEWPVLAKFLERLLIADGVDQRLYLYGWLKVAIEALRNRRLRPGQALVIAGPRDCGKSFLQNLLTLLLGGRAERPFAFMTGHSEFNGDLFRAEHLMVEDEIPSRDIRSRRTVGTAIKNIVGNQVQRCRALYTEAVALTPFWRLSITLNDEPEDLLVLPPLDDTIADKVILLSATPGPMPMPTTTLEERTAFMETLLAELPKFIAFLLQWEIPEELKSPRFGIREFHHPKILAALASLAPEYRLLEIIDAELFRRDGYSEPWDGPANLLRAKLDRSDHALDVRQLLYFPVLVGDTWAYFESICRNGLRPEKSEGKPCGPSNLLHFREKT